MKKLLHVLMIVFSFIGIIDAQSPSFMLDWAVKAGSTNIDRATGVAYDTNGNIYTVGYFGGTVDFDPGASTYTLTANGGYDAFIQKLDPNGNFISAYSFGNANNDIINSVFIDASNNLHIGGYFTGSTDFDLGSGMFALNSGTVQSAFVVKYSSTFTLTWAKMLSGASLQYVNSLAVDNSGNVYTTGSIGGGVIDFDPNATVSNFTVTAGGQAFFVHKLSSAGNLVWAKGFNGGVGTIGNSITVDNNGDPIIGGAFVYSVDFDPNAGVATYTTYLSSIDGFVLKLNASGNYQFAFPLGVGSSNGNDYDVVHSVKVDNSNNIYVGGRFSRTVDFDPGVGIYTMTVVYNSNSMYNNQDAYVAKYSNTGIFNWATSSSLSNTGYVDYASSIDVTASGEVIVSSVYDGEAGTRLSKFSSNGVSVYGRTFTNGIGKNVKMNTAGELLMVGSFTGTMDSDPSPAYSNNILSNGQEDVFTIKFSECNTPASSGLLTGAVSLCNGSLNSYSIPVIIDAEGYTWSNTAGMTGSSLTNTISLTTGNTSTTGVISVTGNNHCGNSPTQTLQVTVTPNTTVTLTSSSTSLCAGSSLTLSASGATSYSWTSGETTASITKNPTSTTVYTVTGYNGNCSQTKTVSVTVYALPNVVVAVSQNTMGCAGFNVVLTASGATSYTWDTGATTNSITVTPTVTTIYTVTGVNTQGCTKTVTKTVTIQTPILNIVASAYTICPGGVSTLTATGATTYTWNGPGGITNGAFRVVTPTITSTYLLGGTGSTGCTSNTNITITVQNSINVSATSSSSVSCSGNPVQLTANGANTYTWNPGALNGTSVAVSPTVATVYTVTGANGTCSGTKTISVNAGNTPTINAITNASLLCTGQTANLTASVVPMMPGMTYTWSTGQNTSGISVSPTITTTYSVIGRNLQGCSTTAMITQSVSTCTSIDEGQYLTPEVAIFPNPNNGSFVLKSMIDSEFEIVNQLGQVVMVLNTNSDNNFMVHVSEMPKGVYFLRNKLFKVSQKIVITD